MHRIAKQLSNNKFQITNFAYCQEKGFCAVPTGQHYETGQKPVTDSPSDLCVLTPNNYETIKKDFEKRNPLSIHLLKKATKMQNYNQPSTGQAPIGAAKVGNNNIGVRQEQSAAVLTGQQIVITIDNRQNTTPVTAIFGDFQGHYRSDNNVIALPANVVIGGYKKENSLNIFRTQTGTTPLKFKGVKAIAQGDFFQSGSLNIVKYNALGKPTFSEVQLQSLQGSGDFNNKIQEIWTPDMIIDGTMAIVAEIPAGDFVSFAYYLDEVAASYIFSRV